MRAPKVYTTFLVWLLSELFEELPEVGDPEKPRLVFFFDEAHLLFDDAPQALIDKVEQVVKLVRSKGVGVYFCTQNPADIPDIVLSQLGNRVQHALRAYTPREQKSVRVAAETFRPNPAFSTEEAITSLGVGEALVSVLEEKGVPSMVGRTMMRPPSSRLGPITPEERQQLIGTSAVSGIYDKVQDRESAFEVLREKARKQVEAEAEAARREGREPGEKPARRSTRATPLEAAITSMSRSVASSLGRALVRGILGSLKRGR
jgi:DNA helicase HerA-like ATPase